MRESFQSALSGRVTIRVTGFFLERFLNLTAKRGLPTWDVQRISETEMLLTTTPAAFRRMRDAAFRAGVRVRVAGKSGLPFRLRPYRRRKALLLGLLLFLLMPLAASQFLWSITVEGCEQLKPSQVLEVLEGLGVKRGAFLTGLDTERIETQAALELDELSFIAINLKGTTAQVQVRERVPVPDSRDPQEIRNLVASRDGQIEVLEVYEGIAMVSRGDTVQKGDLLVSGAIPSEQVGTRYVASDARILARTWKTGTIEAKRVATAQWPTGRQQMRHTLLIGDFSINLYWNSGISMDEYVTLYREKYFTLPWGVTLPIGLRTQALCETATVSRVQSDEELEQLCLAKLQDVVDSLEVEQVLETTHQLEITSEGASLRFEVTCLESIAQPQPFTP